MAQDVGPMELRPYQAEARLFMDERARFIYGDAPGTGKTATTLRWLRDSEARRSLIVAPLAVLDHWQREAEAWYPELAVTRGDGSPKARQAARQAVQGAPGPSALLLHYEGLRIDVEALMANFDTLVCDEAHRLKGRTSLVNKAARRVARRVERLALVTGTPIMNRAEEAWSLLNLLDPAEYSSFWRFAEDFFVLEQRTFGSSWRPVTLIHDLKPEKLPDLRAVLHPVLIQRSLDECLPDLPEAVEIPVPVKLSKKERRIYDQLEQHSWADLGDEIVQASNHLAKVTRERQLVSSFGSVLGDETVIGAKAKAASALVEDLAAEGEQVVVLTAYKATARAIHDHVLADSAVYTGDESGDERQRVLDAFRTGAVRVLIGTLATLGEGVDGLQGARYLVMVDRDWTPARNEQAVARLRRSGQDRTVVVYQVFAEGTIDETVAEALSRKADVIEAVLSR